MWTAPFLMAMINTRVVRRSNALLGFPYGRDFRYDERVDTGRGLRGRLRARALSMAVSGFTGAAAIGPTAWLLRRFMLPDPGEGPSAAERERGGFRITIFGEGAREYEETRSLRAESDVAPTSTRATAPPPACSPSRRWSWCGRSRTAPLRAPTAPWPAAC